MLLDRGEWILTDSEMAAIAAGLSLQNGLLGALPQSSPGAPEAREALDAFRSYHDASRTVLEKALAVLADPRKVIRLHTVQGGESVSRSLLATRHDFQAGWVTLAREGDVRRISLRSESEIRLLVQRLLAADDSLRGDKLGASLSTPAALALLAAVEQLRRGRLIALLNHNEVPELFAPSDVAARLQESSVEDFRWALPFLEKLLPLPIKDLAVAQDPLPALSEMVQGGLASPFDDAVPPKILELTEAGRFLADACWHEVSRAGLGVTALYEDDAVGHDAFLFVRSPFDLFMLHLSGPVAGLSTLLGGDLDLALQQVFTPPPPPKPKPALRVETLPATPPVEATAPAGRTVVWEETVEILPLCLVVEAGGDVGKMYTLVKGGNIGRQVDNDIVLEDPGASRKHASFTQGADGAWIVTDLGSSNGTYVNDARIQEPTALKPGDTVRVSQTLFRFNPGPAGS